MAMIYTVLFGLSLFGGNRIFLPTFMSLMAVMEYFAYFTGKELRGRGLSWLTLILLTLAAFSIFEIIMLIGGI